MSQSLKRSYSKEDLVLLRKEGKRLYLQGRMTQKEIAQQLGFALRTVERWASEDKWTTPKKQLKDLTKPRNKPLQEFDPSLQWIYFVFDEFSNCVKIGITANPRARLKTLQTSCPSGLRLLCLIPGDKEVEQSFHKMFSEYRFSGEWFKCEGSLKNLVETLCLKNVGYHHRSNPIASQS